MKKITIDNSKIVFLSIGLYIGYKHDQYSSLYSISDNKGCFKNLLITRLDHVKVGQEVQIYRFHIHIFILVL